MTKLVDLNKLYMALDRQRTGTIRRGIFWLIIMVICFLFRWNIAFFIFSGILTIGLLIDVLIIQRIKNTIQTVEVGRFLLGGEDNVLKFLEKMEED